jgi:hypothetical protein
MALLDCMAETQLDAHDPPGPEAAVVQSSMGGAFGIDRAPKFPDTSTVIWLGLKG